MYIAEKGREGCIKLKTGRELRKKTKISRKKNRLYLDDWHYEPIFKSCKKYL